MYCIVPYGNTPQGYRLKEKACNDIMYSKHKKYHLNFFKKCYHKAEEIPIGFRPCKVESECENVEAARAAPLHQRQGCGVTFLREAKILGLSAQIPEPGSTTTVYLSSLTVTRAYHFRTLSTASVPPFSQ